VEDPIEFLHENRMSIITNRELGSHTESFALALRAALREDPDVILIGEMRDLETMRLAITAAETGHLVFSTLHTTSPGDTVDRIINVFPAEHHHLIRTSLAGTLAAIVTQTLVNTVDGRRAPVRDILVKSPAVAHLIRDSKLHQVDQAIVAGRREGMQTRDEDLMRLLRANRITRETALAHCTDKKTFLGA
jgi:twitching motility protein PilT